MYRLFSKPAGLCLLFFLAASVCLFVAFSSGPARASEYVTVKTIISIDENAYILVDGEGQHPSAFVHVNGEPTFSFTVDASSLSSNVTVADFNFDGRMDFSVLSSMGASVIFHDVFLFHPETGRYLRNETMSELPCVTTDTEENVLVGSCFHGSACENWQEAYTVSGFDELVLVRRWGTECCPASESCYYVYDTRYDKDGNVISDERTRHPFE